MLIVAFICFFSLVVAWFFAASGEVVAATEVAPASLELNTSTTS